MNNNTYSLSSKDSSSYEDGYKIFLQRSDFRDRILERFSSLAKEKIQPKNPIRVLDIGCGNGEMTGKYLKELKSLGFENDVCLVEPAEKALHEAHHYLKHDFSITHCSAVIPESNKFELIIASYVFYHLPGERLNTLVQALGPNGSLAIMMGTQDNPFKAHPGLKKLSNHGSSDKLTPFLDSLTSSGEFAVSRHKVTTSLDLSGLRIGSALNDQGQKLLGFSLNKDYSTLPAEALEAVHDIYEEAYKTNHAKVHSVHEIIWIQRLK